jgi:hypothetical protein
MHCAITGNLPGVVLFGRILPSLRLPPETEMQAFYDENDVSNISPHAVAEAIQKQWQRRAG